MGQTIENSAVSTTHSRSISDACRGSEPCSSPKLKTTLIALVCSSPPWWSLEITLESGSDYADLIWIP